MNEIRFVKRNLEANKNKNVESKCFYDVLVDGKSLFDEFISTEENMVSCFGFYNDKKLNVNISNEFLKNKTSDLVTGRTALFVCRECVDIGCGAITLEIEKNAKSYVWKNFAHENNSFELEETDYINFQLLEFDKNEYEKAINNLKINCL